MKNLKKGFIALVSIGFFLLVESSYAQVEFPGKKISSMRKIGDKKIAKSLLSIKSIEEASTYISGAVLIREIENGTKEIYKTDKLIGQGAFKKVYLGIMGKKGAKERWNKKAFDAIKRWFKGDDKPLEFEFVAISLMDSQNRDNKEMFDNLDKMLKLLGTLPTGIEPVIANYQDFNMGKFVIINPLYEGTWEDLAVRVAGKESAIKYIPDCFLTVKNGLSSLHRNIFHHGDLKPANFLYKWEMVGGKKRLNCVVADLDSIDDLPRAHTANYYPANYFLTKNIRQIHPMLWDNYDLALSMLETISVINNENDLAFLIGQIMQLSIHVYMNRKANYSSSSRSDALSAIADIQRKMKKILEERKKECASGKKNYCPLFEKNITSFFDKYIFSVPADP